MVGVGDRAADGAGLGSVEGAADVLGGVVGERDARTADARGAEVDQAVLADVERPRAGPALPVGGAVLDQAQGEVVGEVARRARAEGADLLVGGAGLGVERLGRAVAVADQRGRDVEAKAEGDAGDLDGLGRRAGAEDAVDANAELGVLGEELELGEQGLERLLGGGVGVDVVDADLQGVGAGRRSKLSGCQRRPTGARTGRGGGRLDLSPARRRGSATGSRGAARGRGIGG